MKKTAIITGGSRGIGFAIANRLSNDGYNIAVIDVLDPQLSKESFDKLSTPYIYFQGDITSKEDRANFVSEVVSKFGGIHVLVNNAGVGPSVRNDLLEMTEESYDRVMTINTKANMFLTQAVANQMLKQEIVGKKRGTIINVGSTSATTSSTSRGEYCISKAGIAMLTTLYADRLAAEGIIVNEVRPGVIKTDMTSVVKDKYDKMIEDGVFPIPRWGYAEDIANAVGALVSDDFLFTTGNYIDIDGGFHIKRL